MAILAQVVIALSLCWLYFRRCAMKRPPIGVINLWDVALMTVGVVLIPYLYLALPQWAVVGLLGLSMLGMLSLLFEPLLRIRLLVWLVSIALVSTDIGVAYQLGTSSTTFFVVNNATLIAAIVGSTNLWAQSGMKASAVAALGGALAIYDFIFTSQLSVMTDLFVRLYALPVAPMIAWPVGDDGQWLGLGLGDFLMATVFPLVMRKAFGRPAAIAAFATNLSRIATLMLLPLTQAFPVMIVLGPLLLLQYRYWIRRCGSERTTREYLQAEPM